MLNDPSVGKSEAMIKHITGIITDETKRLRFQVEKVLQISMFEKQGDTFKLKHLDLHELINDVVTTFRLKVESMGGEITTNLEATNFNVYADEMHITNVMFNLLDNAIKYHRPEVKPHLDIYTHNHNNRICIHIKDNGIGIKREDLKKIFDKFFRVHTGNRHDVKGFGLGLCYVKSVIKNHKGTIHAESTLGEGTTFYIELPIKNQVT
jgi:signal transduction histidine kinase